MKIQLSEQSFRYIEVHKTTYELERNNSGPVICRDCKGKIGRDMGIYRNSYRRSGYVCFACFASDVSIINKDHNKEDSGFFIDTLGRLRACSLSRPTLSTAEIVESVYRALLGICESSVYLLVGDAHPWNVLDAAEAMIEKK